MVSFNKSFTVIGNLSNVEVNTANVIQHVMAQGQVVVNIPTQFNGDDLYSLKLFNKEDDGHSEDRWDIATRIYSIMDRLATASSIEYLKISRLSYKEQTVLWRAIRDV